MTDNTENGNAETQTGPGRPRVRREGSGTSDAALRIAGINTPPNTPVRRSGIRVADIKVGAKDSRGLKIKAVYTKKDNLYAIYKVQGERQSVVQFADDPAFEEQQRCSLVPLAGMRAKLNHLMTATPNTTYYDAEAANALQLALDGRQKEALGVMAHTVEKAENERACAGRLQYLVYAGLTSAAAIAMLGSGVAFLPAASPTVASLWLAGIGGTIGAFLSLCIAIRSRTVALDIDRRANITDGVLRVLVGAMAAGGLVLLLSSGILPNIALGNAQLSGGAASNQAILVIGFIAGFLERLFPSLLEERTTRPPTCGQNNPAPS